MSIFSKVKVKKPKYSKFDLSHNKKMSITFGNLYPVLIEDIMPGDNFRVSSDIFIRFAPLVTPVMEKFFANIHYFFVPNRLLWDDWQDFIGGGEDGTFNTPPPKLSLSFGSKSRYLTGSLGDYMGVPSLDDVIDNPNIPEILAFPFQAYTLIYNEYYRDQNLTDPIEFGKDGTIDSTIADNITTMRKRSYAKNYFTSALPWAQRGPEVTLPFDDVNYKLQTEVKGLDGTSPAPDGDLNTLTGLAVVAPATGVQIHNIESIGAPTINELRRAYRLQEWLENNARAGARYIEQIMSHFGVKSSDARLQRPEYLGGGKTDVVIDTVYNTTGIVTGTAPDETGNVQSGMSGNGVALGRTNKFKRRFEEHGWIIGIMSVMPYPSYYNQGIPRKFLRSTYLDYPFPEFANLGEQPIQNQEIYLGYDGQDSATFGYAPRYAEFKYGCNTVHGDFRTTLDTWHYAQKYDTRPALNQSFVEYNNNNRIFNVIDQTQDNMYVFVRNNISAIRPLPYFGTPRT